MERQLKSAFDNVNENYTASYYEQLTVNITKILTETQPMTETTGKSLHVRDMYIDYEDPFN